VLQAVLTDWRTAPIDRKLRATLGFLETLTLTPAEVGAADLAPLRAAGVTDEAIEDAIEVCALFSVYNRLADALGFHVPTGDGHAALARFVLKRGYLV